MISRTSLGKFQAWLLNSIAKGYLSSLEIIILSLFKLEMGLKHWWTKSKFKFVSCSSLSGAVITAVEPRKISPEPASQNPLFKTNIKIFTILELLFSAPTKTSTHTQPQNLQFCLKVHSSLLSHLRLFIPCVLFGLCNNYLFLFSFRGGFSCSRWFWQ